jgi:sulfite reductase (NADPH) hemoprotein beta-component
MANFELTAFVALFYSSMKTTYPRLADVVGFITPDQGLEVAKAVLTTQRDNGNRMK